MKITARCAGGFSGAERSVALDTACHPDGAALEEVLRHLDFFCTTPPRAVGADLPRWEITVEDGERCRSLVLVDDGAPDASAWAALLAHLHGAA
ncbi:hypothetical protein G4G28_05950 [Massilia sp. Dwa41.01b]|uniref:protealysin inhibitor emfourin n=1 Tax=unclassified Massilia TaxID=2609279 RepID=UPI001603E7AE|nr:MULTISPECIES: protealysin inhibitor emfourin [unclassified Massilia]QNA88150.1 hypothetical protein G4G28_05950 [Massilia sp. Dwa41.01b]QNA99056.1 hypothetical protein G4G31_09675 [Massilia sp. Se16.2.3]